ncbi:hypothetical protein ACFFS2_13830 [Streptomyces aurantiacus]|uniref:Uncharacterized protein n=1 Tax=Streptomyces aurantiacus TaxID=47760 RepID=A0A7G1NVZ0_9ACTN|nr:hypothetical protein [Streptomyces aurantiacus]BCL25834.1 hypothetical protein GCM10017557_06930 [Streptomyces aurantiacus]
MTSGTHLALTLTLTGGTAADARAVVHTLEPVFGSADALPGDTDATNATVYTASFGDGAPAGGGETPPAASGLSTSGLSTSVAVTLQGSPEAVRRADETLSAAFTVHEEGVAPGDQEQERELRLDP